MGSCILAFGWRFIQSKGYVSAFLMVALLCGTTGCKESVQDDAADGLQPPVVDDSMAADSSDSASASSDAAGNNDSGLPTLPPPPEKLGVGDPSPGLEIAKWIRGEPVQGPLRDRVHVVEFWATWCGPCRRGMPHISELQSELADEVTFIGVTNEDEATVEGFLGETALGEKTWDEIIEYRLAIDDENWMNLAYMKAANQGGIPCAFVVGRDGVIEWIGHPGSIDQPLQEIVSGTWDRAAAIAEYKQQEKLQELADNVSSLLREQDYDGALEQLNKFEKAEGTSKTLLNYRVRVLEIAGRNTEAAVAREALVEAAWDDAMLLSQIAWTTATNGDPSDLELALKAAKRASQLRENEDGPILDTLARCYYELGRLDEAIKWQRQAVEHSNGQRQIEATLQGYLDEQAAAEKSDTEKTDAEESDAGEKDSEPEDVAPESDEA
ncbi:Thiol-disulfide oxidoreductase ResA [Stieleria maiorica]|uniref:Thiol-disulfide oxidoreductase ResA n=1 Tax=Stieleria maiorica TaxID=2795974 RepID=A0A5B9MPH9_9BACT|nr:TlpA disulfide reductase family protein [Stieleria maiorica]QEG01897.1 Thiol-disulfide oxidoreductase ResA [Stieleria maiorica]